ncbi:hypothetical protein IC229_16715 [Spirosoma sp. BT702]|uniref:Uncharacterized protein n=1 Tax=Spirosoma profusum TaxID=2771354 RepID=A0A927ARG6_9BACT|nr:hypothetical protein [Spirosoma profusum]MBD2702298.1 hypothetical protein [Spirosoma profusum]
MKNSRIILPSVILASLLLFVGYCWVLLDWYEDMQLGSYERVPLNTVMETGVILAYCYLAYRFIQARMTGNQPTTPIPKADRKTQSLRQSYSLPHKMTALMKTKKEGAESAGWLLTRSQRLK